MSQPVRVLQIVGIVCGGGVEAVIMNYYRNVDRTKVQFDFVVDGYEKSLIDDEVEALGGHVYHIEPYRRNIFRYMSQIYHIVKQHDYQIVHTNMNSLAVFSLFPAWLAGARTRILHNHSTGIKSEKLRYVLKCVLRPLAPWFANRYLACSRLAGDWMYGPAKMQSGAITVLNNAVDLDSYAFNPAVRAEYRAMFDFPQDAMVIGHVGRFMYQKNHAFLIDMFHEVCQVNDNAYLLLVGDGELRPEIERRVDEYGLSGRVRFLGLRRDVANIYNAMDVLVLPSWYEGLPVVSVEAQANGLPCIFSNYVTAESKLTSSAQFLDLSLGAKAWGSAVLDMNLERNSLVKEEMRKAGFDIKTEAANLQTIYGIK